MSAERPHNDEIRAGWKLAWLEAVADDPSVTGITQKVATKLSQRTERDGIARTASQKWIAERLGTDQRTARRSLSLLRELGHVERCGAGGRGRAAEYQLVRHGTNDRTFTPLLERTSASERPDTAARKHAPGCPPLPFSNKNLLAPGHEPDAPSWPERSWVAIKGRLAASDRLGKDKVEAWLDKLRVENIGDGEVTLAAPSRFIASYIMQHHAELLLAEWQATNPAIKHLTFAVAGKPAALPQPAAARVIPIRERLKAKRRGGSVA